MRLSRREALRVLAGGGVAATAGFASYGFAYERHRIGVTALTLDVHGLPPALAGLRIGLLSDLHHGRFMSQDDIAAAANLVRDAHPDLVVLAGDYVSFKTREDVAPCAEALSPLAAPLGVFAVVGNHDPEATVNSVFEARGVQVLRDEHAHVRVGNESIVLGGLRYWSTGTADIQKIFKGTSGFRILLSHDPRRLPQAAQLGVPLVLSGHTHGGQIVLPGLGTPAAARFPVLQGMAREQRTTIFVSRGLGTVVVPVRLNCPPEVAILTLQPA
jgi:uncharacterized protein